MKSKWPAGAHSLQAVRRYVRLLFKIPHENDFGLIKMVRNDSGLVYIDVGANRGQSIDDILMAKPDARIHAFEPNGSRREPNGAPTT